MIATLWPGEEIPVTERIANEEAAVRRFFGRLGDPSVLRSCYEAGPGGYDLYRLLTSMGVACDVVAPSLIPKGGWNKVKTDKRDASRQARLHRAGELTPVRVPTEAEEAVRDLVRVRAALVDDRKRAQQRLTAVLMRHGSVWTGSYWTAAHRAWIDAQRFGRAGAGRGDRALPRHAGDPGGRAGRDRGRAGPWAHRDPLAGPVARLGCYRGVAELGGLTLTAEIVDWRRFPAARAFMSYTGLVPSEYSSGERTRRGSITKDKAGSEPVRTTLIEAAWAYQHAGDRGHPAPPAGRRGPGHPGPVLEGAAAAERQVPAPDQPRESAGRGHHRGRPRARRVRLGRDDRLTPHELVAYRDARRGRNDPRQICERICDSRPE